MSNKHVKRNSNSYTKALIPYSVWSTLFIIVPLLFVGYSAESILMGTIPV